MTKRLFDFLDEILGRISSGDEQEMNVVRDIEKNFGKLKEHYTAFIDVTSSYGKGHITRDELVDIARGLDKEIADLMSRARELNEIARDLSVIKGKAYDRYLVVSALVMTVFLILSFYLMARNLNRKVRDFYDRFSCLISGEMNLSRRIPITGKTEFDRAAQMVNQALDGMQSVIGMVTQLGQRLGGETQDLVDVLAGTVRASEDRS